MADKKVKGAGDRFLPGSNIAKHREWRGLKDTWYDYVEWVKVLGIMGGFVAKSPVRIARGMLTYRWMGSYLGALNMIDRCVEGLRGPALRVARLYLNTIMKGSTTSIAEMMMGDRRFGDNAFGRTQVVLEQTMCPEILAGFQNLRPAQLEPFQGLLLCYMDQGANPYYIDAMESVGLPADSCRLSNNAAGVALLDEFPKIGACCISNNAPCDSSTMNSQLIERHLDVDTLPAAIPMRWEDPHTRKYARESLRRIMTLSSGTRARPMTGMPAAPSWKSTTTRCAMSRRNGASWRRPIPPPRSQFRRCSTPFTMPSPAAGIPRS